MALKSMIIVYFFVLGFDGWDGDARKNLGLDKKQLITMDPCMQSES